MEGRLIVGILSGPEIRKQVDAGVIRIDPYNPEHINSNSYDVTLGGKLMEYRSLVLDIKDESTLETSSRNIPPKGYLLLPGRGVLGTTIERVHTDRYVPILNGKSTCGRLFLTIHQTAGFGDHGFDGRWTLEIMAMDRPVKLYCGMRIGQIVFETLVGEPEPYDGKYQGQEGTTAAKVGK